MYGDPILYNFINLFQMNYIYQIDLCFIQYILKINLIIFKNIIE